MKTNSIILTAVALLVAFTLKAQVAINTDGSSPNASTMLDIQSTDKGTSFSNLNIIDLSTATPVTSPKTGLIAYNTNTTTGPGLVMWTGTKWVMFELDGICWTLLGNAGTSVGTNFVGTTDTISLAFRTNNTERMRVLNTGEVVVNSTTAQYSGDVFSAFATGGNYAINAFAVNGGAVYGATTGTGDGVIGHSTDSASFGVSAHNTTALGTGLIATGNNDTSYYVESGTGLASTGSSGVYGFGDDSDGTGIIGVGNSLDTIFLMNGGSGGAFTGYTGIYGKVFDNATGTGVVGIGNDIEIAAVTSGGSGGAFTGQDGVYGKGIASAGTGVIGLGNNGSGYVLTGVGSGGAFTGDVCGVYGYASNISDDCYGGYFETGAGIYAYVGGTYLGTTRKIVGNGTVSTIVKNTNGEIVTLVCPEAPEALFQDYGIGQLVNGEAHITIDPDLAININVSSEHPLKVFITLEGDCKGVYVTNKSANGFDVIELQGGSSNVPFSWQIVATRANEEYVTRDGTTEISDYSHRFQPAPGPLETKMEKGGSIKHKAVERKAVARKDIEKRLKQKEK